MQKIGNSQGFIVPAYFKRKYDLVEGKKYKIILKEVCEVKTDGI